MRRKKVDDVSSGSTPRLHQDFCLAVVTKYRHPVITGKLNDRLLEISMSVIKEYWKSKIIEMNTDKDHIHILFDTSFADTAFPAD